MFRLYCALGLFVARAVFAQPNQAEQDRLLAVARLWGTIRYFHPYLAYRDIDWDKALVDALPQIQSASSPAEYAKALGGMLEALKDPATYARLGPSKAAGDSPASAAAERTWIHFGIADSAFAARVGNTRLETYALGMGEGVEAVIRLSEPISPGGSCCPSPRPDRDYRDMQYPRVEYRILAAYKIWAAIRDFFAYRDLMDEDWDDLLPSFLEKLMAANDARAYNLAIAEMIEHVWDSNATVESEDLSEYFGRAPVGLRLRLVEKKPTITEVLDQDAREAGVEPGDLVTRVDDEDIIQRVNRETRYISGSTLQSLGELVMERILSGPEGSTAKLTIQQRDRQSKQISLKRSRAYVPGLAVQRSGEVVKVLPGNIGYVDLDRLAAGEVDGIFERLRDTPAIIFDGRGSTHGLGPPLAARLTAKTDVAAAIVTGPLTLTPDLAMRGQLASTASFFRVEALPPPETSIYKGKTVLLIDERTRGESEHTGLYLESANNTAFVGSASAGADGEVASFVVPGGITVRFSAQDVRHANGGKLQRLGLQPNESVSPTPAGIRAGRDEVLERAIEYVLR